MNPSKAPIIQQILSTSPEGILWRDLVGWHTIIDETGVRRVHLPKKTLDRNLKRLISDGLVEKTVEKSGGKGRPTGRYRISDERRPCMKISVGRAGGAWFPGKLVRGYDGKRAYIRLTGEHKEDYEKMKLSEKDM